MSNQYTKNGDGHDPLEAKRQASADKRRAEWGKDIKMLREAAGLTQEQFARLVGQNYFTMISQVETGRSRVPPVDTERWAYVLGVDTQAFAQRCVQAYETVEYYRAIYGTDKLKDFKD